MAIKDAICDLGVRNEPENGENQEIRKRKKVSPRIQTFPIRFFKC